MSQPIYNFGGIRPPITGIGRYALELVRCQHQMQSPVSAVINHTLYSNSELIEEIQNTLEKPSVDSAARARLILGAVPYSREIYRKLDRRRFNSILKSYSNGTYFEHDINYANPQAAITTIYDLSHRIYPEYHPRHRSLYLNRYFRVLTKLASPIITISSAVRDELILHYGFDEDRVAVTQLAADQSFQKRTSLETASVLSRYGLEHGRYILSVATFEPRKNLRRVIDAYLKLPIEMRDMYPLVLAGAPGWLSKRLKKQIIELQSITTNIKFLGYVNQFDLPYIYSGAQIFVYPSLYEGFGLPLLEAMQSGCACITSDQGALAELAEEAATKVNPYDMDQLIDALKRLISDEQYATNKAQRALLRAQLFSWQRTTEQTLKIYATL